MTLMAIKDYLSQVKMASLNTLCCQFQTEPEMIRCMLSHFIHKGKIRQCTKEPACGSKCFKCPALVTEIYEWVE